MNELLELVARVEAASGPDRELDALIVKTLCPSATVAEYIRGEGDDIVFHASALGIRDKDCCPWYTASLDAAVMLVPDFIDTWGVRQHRYTDGSWRNYAELSGNRPDVDLVIGSCATPALALTAAALRARAAGGQEHE